MIGALIQIGNERAVVISKFPVGFSKDDGFGAESVKMVQYYEIFSMGRNDGKKRRAIDFGSFQDAIREGHIKVLSRARES